MKLSILANHCHVFPEEVRPNGSVSRLLQLMDHCGITQAVTFAPFAYQLKGTSFEGNEWLEKQIRTEKERLIGFGTIDFSSTNIAAQVKRIADMGFYGIKLHPAAQGFHLLSEKAYEVYQEAEKLGLFLSFHTGIHWHRLQDYHVIHYDEIAYHFPKLKISLEHVGGYHFFLDAVAVIVNNSRVREGKRVSNIYAGLTSVFDKDKNRYWYLDRDKLLDLLWQVGPDQLIFGLDFPYNQDDDVFPAIQTIKSLGLTPEQEHKILGGNLSIALGLENGKRVKET